MSSLLYFEVTDLIEFAYRSNRVSGINRVQTRLICAMAQIVPGVMATFRHPETGLRMVCAAAELFPESEFSAAWLLGRIGCEDKAAFKRSLRNYLRPYERRKVLRALLKARALFWQTFQPARLVSLGVLDEIPAADPEAISPDVVEGLPGKAVLMFLGCNWSNQSVIQDAKAHARGGGRVVQLIHDLIPLNRPRYTNNETSRTFCDFLMDSTTYVSEYLTVSHHTGAELDVFLHEQGCVVPVRPIFLAHELVGYERNQRFRAAPSSRLSALLDPFVLCVGTIDERKNWRLLLDVWARLVKERGETCPRLVFAGCVGWGGEPLQSLLSEQPELAAKVQIIHSPSDVELAFLYAQCRVGVFPSHCEGWGLPVGEFAWFGKYAVCSNSTSVPEVCGNLFDYVSPSDPDDFYQKLLVSLDDDVWLMAREDRIRATDLLRTWLDVARMLHETIALNAVDDGVQKRFMSSHGQSKNELLNKENIYEKSVQGVNDSFARQAP